MKYDVNNYSEAEVSTSMEEKDITIAKGSESLIFQIFSKNIYSNPIGSIVREITSNCFDSHIEARVNSPVIIRKNYDKLTGNLSLSFIDFGVGMSPERVSDIFSVMFSSTKRDNNDQIGGFGLGSKTPLAYKRSTGQGEGEFDNSYSIITNYNGFKYTYHIYDGNKCPKITEPTYEVTTERNGTEIQIPVLESDLDSFKNEMIRQLYYFENIVFEGFEYKHSYNTNEDGTPEMIYPLANDYQIIRGKSFLFRGTDYSNNMHVCLGRVAYPIDYNVLGLSSSDYRLPIALKLEIGDVNVTASRENIDYSVSTIKMLKKKLEEAKAEIIALLSKQYENVETLEQYFEVKHNFGQLNFSNGSSLDASVLIDQKDVDFSNFKYSFTKMPNDKQLFRFFFEAPMYGKKPSRSRYSSNSSEFKGGFESLRKNQNLLYIEAEFNRKIVKQAYLKEEHETYYIIRKRKINSKWVLAEIADMFNVALDDVIDDKGNVYPFILSLLEMQEEYMDLVRKYAYDYETLEVPEDFIASRKRDSGITPELRKQSIPVKFVDGYSKDRVKLSTLIDYQMPIFYGTTEDERTLRTAKQIFGLLFDENSIVTHCDYQGVLQTGRYRGDSTKKTIMFIQIAVGNVKYMEHCKNANHIDTFYNKMLYRKANAVEQYFQTYDIIEKFNNIDRFYTDGFIQNVSPKWGKKCDAIKLFIDNIPNKANFTNLRYSKTDLQRYFKIDVIKLTPEQEKQMKAVDAVLALQQKNEKTLNFFNMPYKADQLTEEQISILQLAMSL